MIGNYRGKRLFAGRNFAGRLFGAPQDAGAMPRFRYRVGRELIDAQRLRSIDEDDALLTIAAALCAGAGRLSS